MSCLFLKLNISCVYYVFFSEAHGNITHDVINITLETYLLEQQHSAHTNGNIKPEPTSTASMNTHLVKQTSAKSSDRESEASHYHSKLKGMAQHLAEIANVSLHAQSDSTNDLTFAKLLYDCGNEFLGIGEYLVDVAMTLRPSLHLNQSSVSVDSEYAGFSDDDSTTKCFQDIMVINDDPQKQVKSTVMSGAHSSVVNMATQQKQVELTATFGAHSSCSNVPKSKSKSAADSTEMHACVALNNDTSKSKTRVSESVF